MPLLAKLPTVEARRPLIEGLTTGDLTAMDVRTIVQERASAEAAGSPQATPRAARDTPSTAEQPDPGVQALAPRTTRQSQRELQRARRMLDAMMAQLRESVALMEAAQRSAVLDYIVQAHFPSLEALVEELRQGES